MRDNRKKNLLYAARKAGMCISTKEKTFYLTEEDIEYGVFDKFLPKLKEFGFVPMVTNLPVAGRRILVYPNDDTRLDILENAIARLRKAGMHPVTRSWANFSGALEALGSCGELYLFDGWQYDRKAMLMFQVAHEIGKAIDYNI